MGVDPQTSFKIAAFAESLSSEKKPNLLEREEAGRESSFTSVHTIIRV